MSGFQSRWIGCHRVSHKGKYKMFIDFVGRLMWSSIKMNKIYLRNKAIVLVRIRVQVVYFFSVINSWSQFLLTLHMLLSVWVVDELILCCWLSSLRLFSVFTLACFLSCVQFRFNSKQLNTDGYLTFYM